MAKFSILLSTGTEAIMDNVNVIVAENLKNIRLSKNWSQSFVARQLGMSQRSISRAECTGSVSKRTLKKLCNLYQISMATLYNECVQETPKKTQIISDDVAVGLLLRNKFIEDLQQEVLLRYTSVIQTEALMKREDVEVVLSELISNKKTYTLAEVVNCCLAINQQTIHNITDMAVA